MERIAGDSWQGSEILRERMDSESATTKPRKCLPESESWKRRMSSGDWMRFVGVWKSCGGFAIGTFRGCGTGARMMARVELGSGGIAGARMGR